MLQFVLLNDPAGGSEPFICNQLPFTIGRSASADLQLLSPGVWDSHAQITKDSESGKLIISALGDALLLLNGERSQGRVLLPGDEIQLGGASLRVTLAPVTQKSVLARDGFVWALLLIVTLLELLLIVRLG
jgi:pSer/pThr/pTyr-binding forkhead associated (FHA) protein